MFKSKTEIHDDHAPQRARQAVQSGHSLPAYYYLSEDRYLKDVRLLRERGWLLAGHVSQVPKPGDFQLFEFDDESIIIARGDDATVRAFFNVCRHRGSRICLTNHGHASRLVCPYHSWTYSLDGRLLAARDMPTSFAKADFGLKSCPLGVLDGLIFVRLSATEEPDEFDSFVARMKPFLAPYDLGHARVIAEESTVCAANWKLVVENFAECYHCPGAHPTYSRSHRLDTMLYKLGELSGEADNTRTARPEASAYVTTPVFDGPSSFAFQGAINMAIGAPSISGGIGGESVAPRLGQIRHWSGTWTAVAFNPLCQIGCYDDHTIVFRFLPRGPTVTECIVTWLVREDAIEGQDFNTDAVTQMWRTTIAEDKVICAHNQLGVKSVAYQPGPYSHAESRAAQTVEWYLTHFVDKTGVQG